MQAERRIGPQRARGRLLVLLAGVAVLIAGVGAASLIGRPAVATSMVQPDSQSLPVALNSAAPQPTKPARLVVLGDSVASGAGCGCKPFGQLLASSLAAASGRAVSFTNAARDGLTTQGMLDQLQRADLQKSLARATLVTVTIGANDFDPDLAGRADCLGGTSTCYRDRLASFGPLLGQALARIRSLAPTSRILVTGYWNVFLDGAVGRQQGGTYVQVSDELTRIVNTQVAQQASVVGATYVDLYTPFERRSLSSLTTLLAADGDHPSASGHDLIRNLLLAVAGPVPAANG